MTKWDSLLLFAAILWVGAYILGNFSGWLPHRSEYWEQQAIALSVGIVLGKASRIWLRKQN
jgi:hypothetical protein